MQIWSQAYPFTSEPPKDVNIPLTAFGDLRIAELSPIFQWCFEYTVDNTEITINTATAPATVSQANAMAVVSTSTTTWRKAYLKTTTHARYKAGLWGLWRFTWLFTTWVASTSQWIWLFDEVGSTADFKNGYWVWYDGATLSLVRFQNDVKFSIPRTSWNDKLDGTWVSWMTIDPTKINVFEVRYQYLWAGMISFHIEDDSTWYFVEFHKILYANLNTTPSAYSPNFHLFIFADNKATTSNLTVKSASYAYFIEWKVEATEFHQPQFSSWTITKNTVTTEVALFTIKSNATYASKTNFISSIMELFSGSVEASTPNNLATIRFVLDATLWWVPSYANINTNNSTVSLDTAWTTVTWGKEITSIQLAWKNDRILENILNLKIILQDSETLTVAVSSTNSATFKWSLLWKELF